MCNDTGWVYDKATNTSKPCKCYKERIMTNKIKFACIPNSYKDVRLDNFSGDVYTDRTTLMSAVKDIKYWLAHFDEMKEEGIGIYLWSETKGSGKTRMTCSLANELIKAHNMNVRFVTSLDIISEIKATWDRETRSDTEFASESSLMRYLNNTEVLVIDDFGTEVHRDWLDDKFYQIINTRYVNKLMTLYTSNKRLDDLSYDDRILNRINERTYQIHFPEESVRNLIAASRQRKMKEE
jgi:DNA replication protein DnaC